MHAFCGIICFDNQPIAPATINNMLDSLVLWEPDHRAIWHDKTVAFGQQTQINLPESKYEKLPMVNRRKNLVMVCDARVDNRDELLETFGIVGAKRQKTPDSTLILLAYEKWGKECPKHLLGDFAFAIYNKETRELFCARDHLGARVLFFHHQAERFFAFSTNIRGITKLAAVPIEPNLTKAAYQLALVFPNPEQTYYKDIFSLLPGHTIKVSSNGLEIRKYWEPSKGRKIRYRKRQDYIDHFNDIFEKAVSARLRSVHPIGSHLSGGLDSSSVSAVAANLLKRRGKRLTSFGSVPPKSFNGPCRKNWVNDDRDAMQSVANHVGNIDLHLIEENSKSPLPALEQAFEFSDAPFYNFFNTAWIIDIAQQARALGIKTLLIGAKGNFTISFHGNTIKRLMRSIYNNLSSVPSPLISSGNFLGKAPWEHYSALDPKFCFDKKFIANYRREWLPLFYSMLFSVQNSTKPPRYKSILRDTIGIEYADPTFDKKVVEFCLSIPQTQFSRLGKRRLLIRNAMKRILPSQIVRRKERGEQAANWEKMFETCRDEFINTIQKFKESAALEDLMSVKLLDALIKECPSNGYSISEKIAYRALLPRAILIGKFVLGIEAMRIRENE